MRLMDELGLDEMVLIPDETVRSSTSHTCGRNKTVSGLDGKRKAPYTMFKYTINNI